jgi:hypothetical protein
MFEVVELVVAAVELDAEVGEQIVSGCHHLDQYVLLQLMTKAPSFVEV